MIGRSRTPCTDKRQQTLLCGTEAIKHFSGISRALPSRLETEPAECNAFRAKIMQAANRNESIPEG